MSGKREENLIGKQRHKKIWVLKNKQKPPQKSKDYTTDVTRQQSGRIPEENWNKGSDRLRKYQWPPHSVGSASSRAPLLAPCPLLSLQKKSAHADINQLSGAVLARRRLLACHCQTL